MKEQKIIYYKDELNDEFSGPKITPIKIDENYKYKHGKIWNICSYIIQNFLSMPIKVLYNKLKFRLKYVGKEKISPIKNKDILYMQTIHNNLQIHLYQVLQYTQKEIF